MPVPEPERLSVPVADGVCLSVIVRAARTASEPDAGEAPRAPVLLVHGLASNARMWDGVGEELARLGHANVAVDQRGHGGSDKPDTGYDFAALASDLLAVMDAAGLRRPIVVGQSWGANVVLELAVRHAERVTAVVCVDGALGALRHALPDWPTAELAMTPPDLVGTPLRDIRSWLRSQHQDWPESGIAGALANFRVHDDETVEPWLTRSRHMTIARHLWEHDPAECFPLLRVPVLLLVADPPQPVTVRHGAIDDIIGSGADVRVVWFRPGDHDLHAQFPERVAAAIAQLGQDPPG